MFRDFYYYSPTNGYASAPFTPTVQLRIQNSWQANDPLVNDLTGVLFDSERSGIVEYALPVSPANQARLYGIGQKNNRHKPWAIDPGASDNDPNAFNANLKDPRVRTSDEWHFPTNVVCQLDSLGQIHRGTPWQTIYLKSGIADANSWQHWSGHPPAIAALTHPTNDWTLAALMLDLFRTNSPHNLLSVNAPNQNDWLEIFNGMTALTNTSTFTVNLQPLALTSNAPQVAVIVSSLTTTRASQPGQVFRQLGNVLATPELSLASPYLNRSSESLLTRSITDEAYEKIPAQLLLRLRGDSIGSFEPGPPAILRFTGFDDNAYAVQVSSNLLNWISVSTNYPTNGIFEWRAPPTTTAREFYRSALLP